MSPREVQNRCLKTISNRSIWPHLILSVALALLIWAGLFIGALSVFKGSTPQFSSHPSYALGAIVWVAHWFGYVLLRLAVLGPLAYPISIVFVGLIAVPVIVSRVSASEYAQIDKKHGGSVPGSVGNALAGFGGFLLILFCFLPFYVIGPLLLVVWLFATAWMNKKVYLYGALMEHASLGEREAISRTHRGEFWKVTLIGSVMSLMPVVNLFVPTLCALYFVHFCLGELEALRAKSSLR